MFACNILYAKNYLRDMAFYYIQISLFSIYSYLIFFSYTNLNIVLFHQNLPIFFILTYNSTYFYILYIFLT